MYSYKVEQAIRAATVLHEGQVRKGEVPIPFVSHPVSVAIFLLEYTRDEDTVIAALLHDTIEDTEYTLVELANDFGSSVADIVAAVTEPDHQEVPDWLQRKRIYANQLKLGPQAAIAVAAADKIHNFRSIIEEYYTDHIRYLQDFGKNIDDRIEAYQTISNIINKRLDGKLLEEFNHVFTTFKDFLYDIKAEEEKRLHL